MTDTYVVRVRNDQKFLDLLAKGLYSGTIESVHKVAEEDVPWLRPDATRH